MVFFTSSLGDCLAFHVHFKSNLVSKNEIMYKLLFSEKNFTGEVYHNLVLSSDLNEKYTYQYSYFTLSLVWVDRSGGT